MKNHRKPAPVTDTTKDQKIIATTKPPAKTPMCVIARDLNLSRLVTGFVESKITGLFNALF